MKLYLILGVMLLGAVTLLVLWQLHTQVQQPQQPQVHHSSDDSSAFNLH